MTFSPHQFSLRQLQYAVAVAEELSFRKAAERCRVSQPSLSAQLAELEGALGLRLFERDKKRVLVTPGGQTVIARAKRVLLEAQDLVESARQAGDPLAGTLRVGIIPTVSPYFIPALTPKLRSRFQRLTLAWLEEKTESLLESLRSGQLDATIAALGPDMAAFERELIAEDPFVLALPPGHPLATQSGPATLADLRGAELLLLDDGHCFRDQALAYCAKARPQELAFRATSLSTLVQMVAAGAGITLLPSLALPMEAQRAKFKVRTFAAPAPKRTLAIFWRKSSPIESVVRQFAVVLREAFPKPREPRRTGDAE